MNHKFTYTALDPTEFSVLSTLLTKWLNVCFFFSNLELNTFSEYIHFASDNLRQTFTVSSFCLLVTCADVSPLTGGLLVQTPAVCLSYCVIGQGTLPILPAGQQCKCTDKWTEHSVWLLKVSHLSCISWYSLSLWTNI